MDLAVALGITLLVGIALGAIGVHYIHNVANAATRAVTVPGSAVASLGAAAPLVTGVSSDLQQRVAAIETTLAAAAPKT